MIAWMLYTVVVTAIVAAAARAAETIARALSYRVRWTWIGALALSALLSASSALRLARGDALSVVAANDVSATPSIAAGRSLVEETRAVMAMVGRSLDAPMRSVFAALDARAPRAVSSFAVVAWAVASFGIAALFIAVVRRFARLRAALPRQRMGDVDVRVAPEIGPVALGILRPEIVVPRWLLDRCPEEQGLAVAHEREHLRARDPLLIALGWTVVIAAPWNAALWYMMSRLRLAIEVDCDARVLRRGASAHAYGALLIDVAGRSAPLSLGALTLAGHSHLHQRIIMLRPDAAPFRRVRAAVAVPCLTVGLLVACQATVPASRPVAVDAGASAESRPEAASGPTIFIDGVRSSHERMKALDPARIDHVEVLKGAAAIRAYGDDARNGVVLITTRNDSTR